MAAGLGVNKTLAAFIATITPLLGLFAFWSNIQPAAEWLVHTSALILERPQVQAVIGSMTIGVLFAGMLPHWMPGRWAPETTKALTRLTCFLLTGICCFLLTDPKTPVETRTALIYALMAALAAPQVWTTLSGLFYRVAAKPESLK